LGAKAIGKAALIVYHKAEDITKTLYNDAKDLVHQPFQVLSNPLTMAAVGIGGIAVIYCLTKGFATWDRFGHVLVIILRVFQGCGGLILASVALCW